MKFLLKKEVNSVPPILLLCFALTVDFLKVLCPVFVDFPQKHNNSPQLLNMHFYLTKAETTKLRVPAYDL